MELILYLLLLALVVYGIRWMRSGSPVEEAGESGEEGDGAVEEASEDEPLVVYQAHEALLRERWRMAGVSAHATREIELPRWYYEPAEEWQLDWLERERLPVEQEGLSRGQANDVIGLFQAPHEDDLEVLRFFEEPATGLNRTAARHRADKLLSDPARREAWQRNLPTGLQRAFFRLVGAELPDDVSNGEAQTLIEDHLADHGDELAREWEIFLRLHEHINARAGEYHIAGVGPELLARAVEALRREQGRSMTLLEMNPDLVIDKLLELEPGLELE